MSKKHLKERLKGFAPLAFRANSKSPETPDLITLDRGVRVFSSRGLPEMDVMLSQFLSQGISVDSEEASGYGLNVVVPFQSPFYHDFLDEADDV